MSRQCREHHSIGDSRIGRCHKVLTDHASGVPARRPGLEKSLQMARGGDQIVAKKPDCPGRSHSSMTKLLCDRPIDLVALDTCEPWGLAAPLLRAPRGRCSATTVCAFPLKSVQTH
ncbi:recombinase family protein [Rhodococcus sp. ARC_M8]|uniref:recombinase family protein n=1 Tax=Rhodococcus sp. ARC_M8 TaxID=2928853 RepID=UPI0035AE3DE7